MYTCKEMKNTYETIAFVLKKRKKEKEKNAFVAVLHDDKKIALVLKKKGKKEKKLPSSQYPMTIKK